MIKIVCVALICAVIILYLKSVNSELSSLAIVGSGIIVLGLSLSYLGETIDFISNIIALTGVSESVYKILFKITAIGYLIQFGAGTIEDMGLNGLANKLILSGKIIIFSVSLPIIYALINLLMEILQ